MVLKTEVFLRENILDTSLIQTLFHLGSYVPRMNMHALLSAVSERARECIYECFCKGGLHAPQCDLDSPASPTISDSL